MRNEKTMKYGVRVFVLAFAMVLTVSLASPFVVHGDEEYGTQDETTVETATVATDSGEQEAPVDVDRKDAPAEDGDAPVVDKEEEKANIDDGSFAQFGEFGAEIKGYKVSVSVPEGAFEEGVQLQVREAVADKKDAANEGDNVVVLDEKHIKALEENDVLDGQYLDIAFINKAGEELEPADNVEVRIEIDSDLVDVSKAEDVEKLRMLHLVEDEKGEIKSVDCVATGNIKDDKESEDIGSISYDKKNDVIDIKFVTESFSTVALTATKSVADGSPIVIVDNGVPIVDNYRTVLTQVPTSGRNFRIDLYDGTVKLTVNYPSSSVTYNTYRDYTYSGVSYIKQGNKRINISGLTYNAITKSWKYTTAKNGSWVDMTSDMTAYIDYYKQGASVNDLDTVSTVDSAKLGFHIHMFKYPYSAFYPLQLPGSKINGDDWAKEWRGGLTSPWDQYPNELQGATELGLYSKTVGESGFPWVSKVWKYDTDYFENNIWESKYFHVKGHYESQTANDTTSLKNWFDPNPATKNTLTYPYGNQNINFHVGEANHLFIRSVYDRTGYLYYNSEENAAVLNPKGSDGLLDFSVYKALVSAADENKENYSFFHMRGNYFPFNEIDVTKRYSWDEYDANGVNWDQSNRTYTVNENTDDAYQVEKGYHNTIFGLKNVRQGRVTQYANGDTINHGNNLAAGYFHGMYAYTTFYQPENGKVAKPNASKSLNDMVFEFTGDDDMAVYIDGVLVLDLGGVHDAQSGSINFATGEVKYTVNGSSHEEQQTNELTTTIRDMFSSAGNEGTTTWRGNTFADNTIHKLQMFYMERGQGASNLKIKVNIPPEPDAMYTVAKKVEEVDGVTPDSNEVFYMKVEYQDGNTWKPITDLQVKDADGNTANIQYYYIEGDVDENGNPIPHSLNEGNLTSTIGIKDKEKAYILGITGLPVKIRTTEIGSSKIGTNASLQEYYDPITYTPIVNGVVGEVQNNPAVVNVVANGAGGVVVSNTPKPPEREYEIYKVDGITMPRNTGSSGGVFTWPDNGNLSGITFLNGAEFKVHEATATPKQGGGYTFTITDANLTTVSSEKVGDYNGVIKLPATMNPSSTNTERYFLLEEITEPEGYDRSTVLYGLKLKWDGTTQAVGGRVLEGGTEVYSVKPTISLGEIINGTTIECTDFSYMGAQVIPNYRNYTLPSAGGMGTYWFMLIGAMMMGFALTLTRMNCLNTNRR